ncbi:MAG TPA: SEC-C metal-binding domain-containing protein [Chthoniobacteraceae bacterium]|nr:SEC-C metal-binding domain-containing protein [Chthoniobacteraceae bacterium]
MLNAKYHMQEAEIIARAGQPGSVTISTNMAGRGTDIKLGAGIPDVGGLYVIGTERHEARRIDRQLRGRCARQGDPGLSRFYVSFEDDLMRNFGAADRMTKMMERFGMQENEALEHPWLNRSVETAQKRVEQRNYMIRKRSLDFDDVMNKQREVIYGWRSEAIASSDPRAMVYDVIDEAIPEKVENLLNPDDPNPEGLINWCNTTFPLGLTEETSGFKTKSVEEASEFLVSKVKQSYELKCKHEEPDAVRYIERHILLNAIDRLWQEHLYAMDALREAVYLRAYGQKDPLVEYKNEAYEMFTELMVSIKGEVLHNLFRSTSNLLAFEQFLQQLPMHLYAPQADGDHSTEAQSSGPQTSAQRRAGSATGRAAEVENSEPEPSIQLTPQRREMPKVGRNDPCPCGSGKKYKSCCGRGAV